MIFTSVRSWYRFSYDGVGGTHIFILLWLIESQVDCIWEKVSDFGQRCRRHLVSVAVLSGIKQGNGMCILERDNHLLERQMKLFIQRKTEHSLNAAQDPALVTSEPDSEPKAPVGITQRSTSLSRRVFSEQRCTNADVARD
jgi:hypothetical protein